MRKYGFRGRDDTAATDSALTLNSNLPTRNGSLCPGQKYFSAATLVFLCPGHKYFIVRSSSNCPLVSSRPWPAPQWQSAADQELHRKTIKGRLLRKNTPHNSWTFLEFLKIAKWIWKLDLTVSGAEPERSPQRVENSWKDRQQSLLKVTHVVQSLSPIYSAPFVWKLQLKLLSEWRAKWRKCWACWNCENKRELWGVLQEKKMKSGC